jgi:hypothetical protein
LPLVPPHAVHLDAGQCDLLRPHSPETSVLRYLSACEPPSPPARLNRGSGSLLAELDRQLAPVSPKGIDIVQQTFRPSTLVPRGLVVDEAMLDGTGARITVRAMMKASVCPGCGTQSERGRSRCRRRLADLPIAGRPDCLMVLARRFCCNAVLCGRRVFATPCPAGAARRQRLFLGCPAALIEAGSDGAVSSALVVIDRYEGRRNVLAARRVAADRVTGPGAIGLAR